MAAPTVEGIDLFNIAGRSISGWVKSFKMSAAAPVKLPFCSQHEERLLLWLEYHPLIASYARGDIGPQFAATYRLPIRHPAPFTIGYLFEGKPHTMETSGESLQVAPSRSTAQCPFFRVTVPIDLQVWAKSGPARRNVLTVGHPRIGATSRWSPFRTA